MKKLILFFPTIVLVVGLGDISLRAQSNTVATATEGDARVPVDAAHTPGNDSAEFIISAPGSYYLTENVDAANEKIGIEIATNNVTLDLNGFSVSAGSSGVYIPCGTNCAVQNGNISDCSGAGVYCSANNVIFDRLNISTTGYGIQCLGDSGVIRDCSFYHNANTGIILYGGNYLITGNICSGNNSQNAANGATIFINTSNNRIENNFITGSGPLGYGIWINTLPSTTNNIIIRNSVAGCGANNYKINDSLNDVGPIGSASMSINPWANISRP